jgi:hypothetical protein
MAPAILRPSARQDNWMTAFHPLATSCRIVKVRPRMNLVLAENECDFLGA